VKDVVPIGNPEVHFWAMIGVIIGVTWVGVGILDNDGPAGIADSATDFQLPGAISTPCPLSHQFIIKGILVIEERLHLPMRSTRARPLSAGRRIADGLAVGDAIAVRDASRIGAGRKDWEYGRGHKKWHEFHAGIVERERERESITGRGVSPFRQN